MLKIFQFRSSSRRCYQCGGIGYVEAIAIVPCGCSNTNEDATSHRCAHCRGARHVAIDVDDVCPACHGTAVRQLQVA
jgi:DnaJ-class molecular chaperone